MRRDLARGGRSVLFSGTDENPASSTCGMHVAFGSRETTEEERVVYRALSSRIAAAPVNAPPGQEGHEGAHQALDAWVQALPRTYSGSPGDEPAMLAFEVARRATREAEYRAQEEERIREIEGFLSIGQGNLPYLRERLSELKARRT